jgi:uncharacterized protein (UPF0147 family)
VALWDDATSAGVSGVVKGVSVNFAARDLPSRSYPTKEICPCNIEHRLINLASSSSSLYVSSILVANTCGQAIGIRSTKRATYENSTAIRHPATSMVDIVVKDQAIPRAIAKDACESLQEEIDRKRREGALEAGEGTSVSLEWTEEAIEALRAYEEAFKAHV